MQKQNLAALKELMDEFKVVHIEHNKKLSEINTKIDNISRGGRAAGTRATGAKSASETTTTTSSTPKGATPFPGNSMIWWKNRFENEENLVSILENIPHEFKKFDGRIIKQI